MPPQRTAVRTDRRDTVEGPMTLERVIQLLSWLDEEHRRDKAQISELMDSVNQFTMQVGTTNKSIQDLEERIARLQSQSLRYSQIEQAVNQVRAEVQGALDTYEQRRLKADGETYKIRDIDRGRHDQVLSTIQLQVEALQQWQRGVIGDHDFIGRMEEKYANLRQHIEQSYDQTASYEQRLQVIENWVSRAGQITNEMHQLGERMQKERAEAADAGRRAELLRARHMAEWAEQMKALRLQVEEVIPEMRGLSDEMKKRLPPLTELEERLKVLEPRLNQWQRLMDDSRRKERDQIVADIEKRWQQQLSEWQFVRDEWNKRLNALVDRVTKLEELRPELVPVLQELRELIDKERRDRLTDLLDLTKIESERDRHREKIIAEFLQRLEAEASGIKKRPVSKGA